MLPARTIEPANSLQELQRKQEEERELESRFEPEEQANALVRLQARVRAGLYRRRYMAFLE